MSTENFKEKELVSVIMNCCNSEKYIKEAVDSVLNQTYKNWELIIWDNFSNDNTSKIINSINDQRIIYFYSEIHLTLGEARNEALKISKGKYITFLDSDDIWLANKLMEQIKFIKNNPKINFLYSDYFLIDENGKRKFKFNLKKYNHSGKILNSLLTQNTISLVTVFFESSFIKKEENLFDTSLEVTEEFEFFTRLLKEYNAYYIDKPLAKYRIHSNMTSKIAFSKYPDEIIYIIKKLRRSTDINNDGLKTAIEYLECKVKYYQANLLMKNGKRSDASKLLYEIKNKSVIFYSLYLLSLFNPRIWIKIHILLNRY